MSLADMRRDYRADALSEQGAGDDPLALFDRWLRKAAEVNPEPNAFVLATLGNDGKPAARVLLCKGREGDGFLFFTNLDSRKGHELIRHPWAAMCFHWPEVERQIRIEGAVDLLKRTAVEEYFHSRPRTSQLGAWASPQSRIIETREDLEQGFASVAAIHSTGEIPVPPHWGGFCLKAEVIEFWQGRPSRLHDRLRYRRHHDQWIRERLAP